MQATADWLDRNASNHERFFLFVDEFDPHEPFDTPERWAYRYHDQRDEPLQIWPPYARQAISTGAITERQGEQLRANYGAKLSMIDHWFGRVLDAMDRLSLWDDTALFLLTDHGHYLGERDGTFGKPLSPVYDLLGGIPVLVSWPGVPAGVRDALTTGVDVHATLTDLFDLEIGHRTHGVSLRRVIEGAADTACDHLVQGYFGREVNVIDADGKYIRGVEGENTDISVWSNRWSTMPVHAFPRLSLARPDSRADRDNLPGSDVPANRSPPTTWQTVPSSRQAGRREPGRNSTTPPTPGNRTTWSTHGEPTTTQNCSATPSPRSRPPRSSWSASASAEANGGRGIRAASAGGRHQVAHWPIRVHELADL